MNRLSFVRGAAGLLAARPVATAETLSARMDAIARTLFGRIGIYARTMNPGPPLITYGDWQRFPTASTIKVLIMATAFVQEERAPGTLEERITFNRSDLIGGSDFMSEVGDGHQFTVRQLLTPMITVSDNTAANLLIGFFGVNAINAVGERAGMAHTHLARKFLDYGAIVHHHDNVSTPADMGRLLFVIERGARERIATIASAAHCRAMVGIMLHQTDRDGIPAALPHGIPVANKTGEVEGTRNDVAIVDPFGDSPFILAIMTRDVYDYRAAYAAIHAATRAAYAAVARTFA